MTDTSSIHVLIVGAGPAGLINARTLLQDGFKVTMVTKDAGIGGCWYSTYPDLGTNSPWGGFTFSGLDMPKPSNSDGKTVPARTYRRYLEDLFHYFVESRATVLYETQVVQLEPLEERGWRASLKTLKTGDEAKDVDFDRVVLATGYLGKSRIPVILQNTPIPVHHSSTLALPDTLASILASTGPMTSDPTSNGDADTVLVIGGGKSGMDAAAILANRGRKVVWTYRQPLKWYSPAVAAGGLGAGRMDIIMGPKRSNDSWAAWLYHCTFIGARWTKGFWAMMRAGWSTVYVKDRMPAPESDPFLTLANFAGGIPTEPTDFLPLVKAGKIATLPLATPIAVSHNSVVFNTKDGERTVKCGAVVAAAGYDGGNYEFIDSKLRLKLGLEKVPPRDGWQERVLAMRDKWTTIVSSEVEAFPQPLVYRGILPVGRWKERDLAVSGGTRPFGIPALMYEVESHISIDAASLNTDAIQWIASLFQDDPSLTLPRTLQDIESECHADKEYNLARYPGIDPYALIPSGTYFVGFNDHYHSRLLLREMGLDYWRQKSQLGWWRPKRWFGDWLDVRVHPEQYAGLGDERSGKRAVQV